MLPEQYAFQLWSLSIFYLEISSRLLMIQDYKVLMVVDHIEAKISQKPILYLSEYLNFLFIS